jgi:hypothetical protein
MVTIKGSLLQFVRYRLKSSVDGLTEYCIECVITDYLNKVPMRLYIAWMDSLCGLVVRIPGYRSSGSTPGTIRFSEKYGGWNGVHSAS